MDNVKVSNPVDWKEIGITFGVTLVSALVACSLVQFVIVPAVNKMAEKRKQKAAEKK